MVTIVRGMPSREAAMQIDDKWLTTSEAIARLASMGFKRAPVTLAHWAQQGLGPPFRKDASRYRYYSQRDLDRWMASL